MIEATLQFGNLAADLVRTISALDHGNMVLYQSSLERAYQSLATLRAAGSPVAYEEGLLMMRGFLEAKARGTLDTFRKHLNRLVVSPVV
jgi:hypothetical protein